MLTGCEKSHPGWPCCQVGSCLSSQSRHKQTRVSRQDTSCPSGCSSLLPPCHKIVSSNGSWPCHFPSGPHTLLLKTRQSPHHHALSWSSSLPGNHGGLQFRPRNLQIPAQRLLLTWKVSSSRPSSESGACSVSFKLSLSLFWEVASAREKPGSKLLAGQSLLQILQPLLHQAEMASGTCCPLQCFQTRLPSGTTALTAQPLFTLLLTLL